MYGACPQATHPRPRGKRGHADPFRPRLELALGQPAPYWYHSLCGPDAIAARLAITERRDVLAHRVANFALAWNGGRDRHDGRSTPRRLHHCPRVCQEPGPVEPGLPPTVLEKTLLDNASGTGTDILPHDPVTGVPALHCAPSTRSAYPPTHTLRRLRPRTTRGPHPQRRALLDPHPGRTPVAGTRTR